MDTSKLRAAAADPDAPWYGSDLVPVIADAADEIDRLRAALADADRVVQIGGGEIERLRARLALAEPLIAPARRIAAEHSLDGADPCACSLCAALAEWEAGK